MNDTLVPLLCVCVMQARDQRLDMLTACLNAREQQQQQQQQQQPGVATYGCGPTSRPYATAAADPGQQACSSSRVNDLLPPFLCKTPAAAAAAATACTGTEQGAALPAPCSDAAAAAAATASASTAAGAGRSSGADALNLNRALTRCVG